MTPPLVSSTSLPPIPRPCRQAGAGQRPREASPTTQRFSDWFLMTSASRLTCTLIIIFGLGATAMCQHPSGTVVSSGHVDCAEVVHLSPLDLTSELRSLDSANGPTVIELWLDTKGKIESAKWAYGFEPLKSYALSWVKSISFSPTLIDGVPLSPEP